ncbi:adenosylcobinamide-phosphate synthase CbiB [Desulfobacterales bacterium HSG2]|nr:adenosylcobinamide-phosphate synthase CbiB [Desulfobacterales bacterium HSG2]
MECFTSCYIVAVAFILDLILGDPHFAHHPIRYMGKAITISEPHFRKWAGTSRLRLSVAGALFSITLISCVYGLTSALTGIAGIIHPACKAALEIVMIYFCLSARGLEDAATEVCDALNQMGLQDAKEKLALIVGRDVRPLSKEGVTRAAVETVAENLVDGVISPLFFAAVGGAPLAMAYKMVNTLDSMIGYRNEMYEDFGKAAARIDDVANFIPARLSVPVISAAAQILSGRGVCSMKTAIREGANHSSPNAGYPEAAYAGTLGVRLGGPNYYHGSLVSKPYIGTEFGEVRIGHIRKACDLMYLSSFLWLVILIFLSDRNMPTGLSLRNT